MRPEDIYTNGGFYITAADLKAVNDRRRSGALRKAPEVVPAVRHGSGPMPVDVRAMLAKKRLAALVASGANRRTSLDQKDLPATQGSRARRGPRSVIVASGLRSDHVSLRLQSPEEQRRDVLAARRAALVDRVAPKSLVASAMEAATPVNDKMSFGMAASADGDRVVTVMVPR